MSEMNPVVHFEMPYDDPDRMKKFYTKTFGWQLQAFGQGMEDYVLATTAETGKDRMIKKPGCINGGFFAKNSDYPVKGPSLVIQVEDLKASMKKVIAAGGKVIGEPMEIPGVGQWVTFLDTEGNQLSMLQSSNM